MSRYRMLSTLLAGVLVLSLVLGCTSQPAGSPAPGSGKAQQITLPTTEPPTLDPGLATDTVSVNLAVQLFEGLLEFDRQGNPKPVLAEKWTTSPDGRVYTFTIRDGPKWSDGTPVTAKDFEFAWKRNLDPKTASDYAQTLYPIKGAEAFNTGKATSSNSVGVKALDERTLEVTLEQPAAYFLRLAATWTAFALPRAAIERHGDKWTEPGNIVTNGPYRLGAWKHDAELVLTRNDGYWGDKPTIERATYNIFPETEQTATQILAAFESGEIDVATDMPAAEVDRVKSDPKLRDQVLEYVTSGTFFIVPKASKPPFDKKEFRQALSLVIDREKLNEIIRNPGKPATSIFPPGIPRKDSVYPKTPDVEKAKALLAEAGYADPSKIPPITYTYNTNATHKMVAEYLQDVWSKQLGLTVKLDSMEWKTFLKWRTEANFDIARGGWLSDYEDGNNWYNVLLDSTQSSETFAPAWKSEAFDKLVRQARAEQDPKQREVLYQQADEMLASELPFIPLYYYGGRQLVRPTVKGYQPAPVLELVYLRDLRIEQ